MYIYTERNMAASLLPVLFLFSTMLAASSAFGNPKAFSQLVREKKEIMVVEGMIYCQSCAHTGSWSLTGAHPLPSAKVGISCKDYKSRVGFYKSVRADGGGYFYAPLEGLSGLKKYYKGDPVHACRVRLLSSPNGDCNLLTNINGGIEGAMLRNGNKTLEGKHYKAVVYSTMPLAFRPSHCRPPMVQY